jgi:hypothetical protein
LSNMTFEFSFHVKSSTATIILFLKLEGDPCSWKDAPRSINSDAECRRSPLLGVRYYIYGTWHHLFHK